MSSIANSIFGRDIVRLAQSVSGPQLVGRQITEPTLLDEAKIFFDNGVSRAEYAAMRAVQRREEAEAKTLRDLTGYPPTDIVSTKGLSQARAQLARFYEWQHQEGKRLDDLRSSKAELEAMIAAPVGTETKIREAVKQTATTLVGRAHSSEKIDRAAMDAQLAQERHQAEAAQIAIVQVDRQIEIAELRCDHLNSRESEFLNPALVEAADEIGLGKAYMRKLRELRAIMELMNGLAHVAGDFGSGFGQPSTVSFSKVGLPSLANIPSADYTIPAAGNAAVWEALARALKMNPRMDPSRFIAVPK